MRIYCEDCNNVACDSYNQWMDHLQSVAHQRVIGKSVWKWPPDNNQRSIVVTGKPNHKGEFGELLTPFPAVARYFSHFDTVSNMYNHPSKRFCIIQLEKREQALKVLAENSGIIGYCQVVLRLKSEITPEQWRRLMGTSSFSEQVETKPSDRNNVFQAQRKHSWLIDQIKNLDADVQLDKFMTIITMNATDYSKREQVRTELLATVKHEYSNAKIVGLGDVVTGLGGPTSVLDLCFQLKGSNVMSEQEYLHVIIDNVNRILACSNKFYDIRVFRSNAVTYIKGVHRDTNVKLHLWFNNEIGVYTSKLIRFFASLDTRVLPLILTLRYWAEYTMQPPNSFDACTLELLTIVFLNCIEIVPNAAFLQDRATGNIPLINNFWNINFCSDLKKISDILAPFAGRNPIIYSNVTGKPTASSILSMAKDFFRFYSDVDFPQTVICTLLGSFLKKQDFDIMNKEALLSGLLQPYKTWSLLQTRENRMRMNTPICVQNPFHLGLNVSSEITESAVVNFQNSCYSSAVTLERMEDSLMGLPNFLDFISLKEHNFDSYYSENIPRRPKSSGLLESRPATMTAPSSTVTSQSFYNDDLYYRRDPREGLLATPIIKTEPKHRKMHHGRQSGEHYEEDERMQPPVKISRTAKQPKQQTKVKKATVTIHPPEREPKRTTSASWSNFSGYAGLSESELNLTKESQEKDLSASRLHRREKRKRKRKSKQSRKILGVETDIEVIFDDPLTEALVKKSQLKAKAKGSEPVLQIPPSTCETFETPNSDVKKKKRKTKTEKKLSRENGTYIPNFHIGNEGTAPDGKETFELRIKHAIRPEFTGCFNFIFANLLTEEERNQKCTALWGQFFRDFYMEVWDAVLDVSVEDYDSSEILRKLMEMRANTQSQNVYTSAQLRGQRNSAKKKFAELLNPPNLEEQKNSAEMDPLRTLNQDIHKVTSEQHKNLENKTEFDTAKVIDWSMDIEINNLDEETVGQQINGDEQQLQTKLNQQNSGEVEQNKNSQSCQIKERKYAGLITFAKLHKQYPKDDHPYQKIFDELPQKEQFSFSFLVRGYLDAYNARSVREKVRAEMDVDEFNNLKPFERLIKFNEKLVKCLPNSEESRNIKEFVITVKVDTEVQPPQFLTIFTEIPECPGMIEIFFNLHTTFKDIGGYYFNDRFQNWLQPNTVECYTVE